MSAASPGTLAAPIRVLHCPDVVGGHAPQLARAERSLGAASVSVALRPSPYGYQPDETLGASGDHRAKRALRRLALLVRALHRFDVVHFNFGSSILPALRDLPLLRAARKGIFFTYQGDDARQGDYCRKHFEIHFAHEVDSAYYPAGSDAQKRKAVATAARYADGLYALNPDLLYVLPRRAGFLPYASVDLGDWRPVSGHASSGLLKVVHAPSHRGAKGTHYLVDAVNRLKAEGVAIELILVENVSRDVAREQYAGADVVIDQLLAGWYGGLAVEAMALGKPVVAYIRDGDLKFIPEAMRSAIPVINANPRTIYEVLNSLATKDRGWLAEAGMRGRSYVEAWHDPLKIAASVIADYRRALERTS